jgi:hypothetical protein
MPFPEIKTEDLIKFLEEYPDVVIKEAAKRLKDFNNDWHQPELCNEKYNNIVIECNAWEELCDEMYDCYDTPHKIEEKYLKLKEHYVK